MAHLGTLPHLQHLQHLRTPPHLPHPAAPPALRRTPRTPPHLPAPRHPLLVIVIRTVRVRAVIVFDVRIERRLQVAGFVDESGRCNR
jgi:hypothetical protein